MSTRNPRVGLVCTAPAEAPGWPPARTWLVLAGGLVFYSDVEDFGPLNEIYARHMPDPPPARSAPANVRLPRGPLISIEAIAVLPAPPT